jgi:hypothetical protein
VHESHGVHQRARAGRNGSAGRRRACRRREKRMCRRPQLIPLCDLRGETGRRVGVGRVGEGRRVCADGHSPSPLCDLRGLCAMLSPRVFLAQKLLVSPKKHPATAIPLCDLGDLCAVLSPSACFSPRCHGCPPTSFLTQQAGISLPVCAS